MKTKQVCDVCGSDNILQQISFMTNPNDDVQFDQDGTSWEWDDFHYCIACGDTCHTKLKHERI
jgi:hypothetical protein